MKNYLRKQLDVAMFTLTPPDMRVMRGKALLDDTAGDLKFVENTPRGPRSVEVGRTLHSRFVRRPDGTYTVTIRCDGTSKYLREELTAEVAEIAKVIAADRKTQDKLQKDEEKRLKKEGEKKDEVSGRTEEPEAGKVKKADA